MATEQALHEILKVDGKLFTSLRGSEYQRTLKHDSKWLIEALSGTLKNDFYIFSSTQHTDKYEAENGSLVMWRGYGNDNGCALVFDKEKLVALADALHKNGAAVSTIDGEICYPNDIEEVKLVYAKEYRFFVDYVKHIAEASWNLKRKPFYGEVKEGPDSYIKMKALIKHHAFKSENEYRLSILRSIPTIKRADMNLISVENGTIRLPIFGSGIPIKKIIIAPFSNQDENYKILQDFIKSNHRFQNIKITKSAIPHT